MVIELSEILGEKFISEIFIILLKLFYKFGVNCDFLMLSSRLVEHEFCQVAERFERMSVDEFY